MSNEDLAQTLGVTVQTIRRDLTHLADAGLLARYHGGASPSSSVENIAYTERRGLHSRAKDAIGAVAARLIPDGASLFINIGTTTEAFARALTGHRDLHVITNNLHVAAAFAGRRDFRTVIAGGLVRPQDGGIVGAGATESLSGFRAEFGVIGISGIEEDGTLLDFDLDEIQCARAIMRHARRVVLLADHTKFSRHPVGRVGDLSNIHDFVTDRLPQPEFCARLEAANVTLHIPDRD
ncbi:DeoR family transcriptional regulator [Swaminathania salitolerans]|uniref:DeoR family transcriptional regulator n=2 Tax=Swaminathania salitolerans TaxID=182838 RepID=A0A511BU37_9PROT|nr:DeoR family transcriptional regulator [Swaminathania salitolerans]